MRSYIVKLEKARRIALARRDYVAANSIEKIICRTPASTRRGLYIQTRLLELLLEGSGLYRDGRDQVLARTIARSVRRIRLSPQKRRKWATKSLTAP